MISFGRPSATRSATWALSLFCLLVSAIVAPVDGARLPASRFVLHIDGHALAGSVGQPIEVYFNPKEITADKKTPWATGGRGSGEGDKPDLEFTSGERYQALIELVFDSFENGGSVKDVSGVFERLVQPRPVPDPPIPISDPIPVTWGQTSWTSRLHSASTRFTRWDANGAPTRAVVTTVWSTFDLVGDDPAIPFTVEIPGLPATSARIREVSIAPLTIDLTRRPPDRHRIFFEPPRGRQATASLTFAHSPAVGAELQAWSRTVPRGTNLRKSLTVTMYGADRMAARTYALIDCGLAGQRTDNRQAPVPYVTVDVACERVVVQDASSETSVRVTPTQGFMVSISGAGGTGSAFFTSTGGLCPDSDVEDVAEGGMHEGSRRRVDRDAGRLVLVGPPTGPRPLFIQWVNDAAHGDPWKATLTVSELNGNMEPGPPSVFLDAAPSEYVFAHVAALNSTGNVREEIHVKVGRFNMSPTNLGPVPASWCSR